MVEPPCRNTLSECSVDNHGCPTASKLDEMFRVSFTARVPYFSATRPPGHEKQWLLYGDRFLADVPAVVVVTPAPDDKDPLDVEVTMTIDIVDGRLACTSLTVDKYVGEGVAAPITGEDLRRIPVAGYVEMAALDVGVLQEVVWDDQGEFIHFAPWEPPPADFASHGMTDEALEQIARFYAAAQATGSRPSGL